MRGWGGGLNSKGSLPGSHGQSTQQSWAVSCTGSLSIVLCALGSADKTRFTPGTREVKQNKMVVAI